MGNVKYVLILRWNLLPLSSLYEKGYDLPRKSGVIMSFKYRSDTLRVKRKTSNLYFRDGKTISRDATSFSKSIYDSN